MAAQNFELANRQIFNYRMKGNYRAALEVYKEKIHQKFSPREVRDHDQLICNVLHCLRKIGKPQQGLEFLLQHLQYNIAGQGSSFLQIEAGWCFFDWLRQLKPEEAALTKNTMYIVKAQQFITTIKPDEQYLLFSRLFFELCRISVQAMHIVSDSFSEMSENLHSRQFSDASGTSTKINPKTGKPFHLSSDREKFYSDYSKLLFALGKYKLCYDLCMEALTIPLVFAGGNRLWIARRLAMCMHRLGKPDQAAEKMLEIATKKNDWFLWVELGMMYEHAGNHQHALNSWAKGFLLQGHSAYKVGFYDQLALWFDHRAMQAELLNHFQLAIATRTEQDWKIPALMQQLRQKLAKDTALDNAGRAYKKCCAFWQRIIADQDTSEKHTEVENWQCGTITAILNGGANGDGFITTDAGKGVYFRTQKAKGRMHCVIAGARVRVLVVERKYKGRDVLNARKIIFDEP